MILADIRKRDKMKEPKKCPKCGDDVFHQTWAKGRKLRYRCEVCHWLSEPFTPPQQEITAERKIIVSQFGGFEYTVYDEYGHVMVFSRTYDNRNKAIEALKENLKSRPDSTAVLWPETVIAKGEVFK